MTEKQCACHSGKSYGECCEPFHKGELPSSPLQLMRSRYSAYALGLADYIIETTHPDNPFYSTDFSAWKEDIVGFSNETQFSNLEILEHQEDGDIGEVSFHATLMQGERDVSFSEHSLFCRDNGKWVYLRGKTS